MGSDYQEFCESFGGCASDPDFMNNWLSEHVVNLSWKDKYKEKNEKLERFYQNLSGELKGAFEIFTDEDEMSAIAHKDYCFLRIHQSTLDRNPDFYIRVRSSLTPANFHQRFLYLVSENKLRAPTKDYQKDHTFYINSQEARVKEDQILSVVNRLISFITL